MYTIQPMQRMSRGLGRLERPERETIHSGQFMVSDFEAEEQDDEENVAVPIPETTDNKSIVALVPVRSTNTFNFEENKKKHQPPLAIDTSLSKLFQCMSLAYKQKLTSPKWNTFRGIRLRWKDKIRLNNVIWRCWHLQFIKKEPPYVCQFASPMDADTHNKPEAVVLEGKYWKRKLEAVTAEYKRWRLFYKNRSLWHMPKEISDPLKEMDMMLALDSSSTDEIMMIDEDYMGLMTDTLFSSISSQPYVFPDSREIAKAGLADFIQPSLGPLQPNLDDIMDIEAPIQELMGYRLPPVPEENQASGNTQTLTWGYIENSMPSQNEALQVTAIAASNQQYQLLQLQQDIKPVPVQDTRQSQNQQIVQSTPFNDLMFQSSVSQYLQQSQSTQGGSVNVSQPPSYTTVISKSNPKSSLKNLITSRVKHQPANIVFNSTKTLSTVYPSYSNTQRQSQQNLSGQSIDRISQNTSQVPTSIQPSPIPELQPQYKIVQHSHQPQHQQESRQGYKFQVPNTPNIKFTSHQVQHAQLIPTYSSFSHFNSATPTQKDPKSSEPKRRGAPRSRRRSSSNTREPIKKPPLLSAISDPSLLNSQNSALLTQLLTNNSSEAATLFRQNRTLSQDAISSQSINIKKEDLTSVALLSQSTPLLIPAQVSISSQPPTPESLLFSNSNSPITDPLAQSIHSPTSSQDSIGSPSAAESPSHKDRRVGHIHAEQKRRCNIKNGFDMLHSLIPHLNQNPNSKLSKAALLQKGAEYITQLRGERNQLKDEIESLKQQIQMLKTSISNCQSMLPATGAPVSRRSDSKMQEMFDEYVRNRTIENWKFWIFSLIFRPLLNSFNNFVSTSTLDDLYTSTMHWVEQHCTLVDLRPVLQNSLTYLCKKTDILANAERLPEEAREIVLSNHSQSSNQSN